MDASWVMFHQQKKHSNPADAQCIHRSRRPQLNPNTDYWLIIRKIPKDRIYMDIRIYDAIQATQKSLRVNLINQPTNQPTYLPTYLPTNQPFSSYGFVFLHIPSGLVEFDFVSSVPEGFRSSLGCFSKTPRFTRKIWKEWLISKKDPQRKIWLVVEPTHLKNMLVKLDRLPKLEGVFYIKKYLSCHHLEIVCTKFHAQTISTLTMVTRSRGVSIWLFILLLTRNFMRLANCNKIIIPIYGSISIGSFQTSQITTPTNIKLCQNPPTQRSLQRGVVSLSVGQHALSLGPNTKHHPADGNPHWAFAKPKNVEICNKPATFHGITI